MTTIQDHAVTVRLPTIYKVGRRSNLVAVHDALAVQPPVCVVVSSATDYALARVLSADVLLAKAADVQQETAQEISTATDRAVAMIVDGDRLIAQYADGTEEEWPC